MRTSVIALLAWLACAAPAVAAERVTAIAGAPGPGPSKHDKAFTVRQALDYYLGWLTNPAQQPRFQPLDQFLKTVVPFLRTVR